ncbi:hypothetical protein [Variovorax sp. DAIF25]|uniref:hypothetical protein n=1 Tax=Variovorax sp. DAIF25 TaxID=3080983 RepID=UPI003D6C60ED
MKDRLLNLARAARAWLVPAWSIREEDSVAAGSAFVVCRAQFGRLAVLDRLATLRAAVLRMQVLRGIAPAPAPAVDAARIARALDPRAPEESAHSPEGRVYRGDRAREVLQNEAFAWAFETTKSEIYESWQATLAANAPERERLWLALQMLDRVQAHLVQRLETGKLAALELKHRAKVAQQQKAWLD